MSASSAALKDIALTTLTNSDSQRFIREVTDYAIDCDKQFDDEWMAEVAGLRMFGDALEWHTDLDDNVQESWKRLKKALVRECKRQQSDASLVNTPPSLLPTSVPTPAAAPTPVATYSTPPISISSTPTTHAGRIRVKTKDPQARYYLSTTLSNEGAIRVTSEVSNALIVEFVADYDLPSFKILNSHREEACLGIHWSQAPSYGDNSQSWGRLAIVGSTRSTKSSWTAGQGPSMGAVFLVLHSSKIVIADPTVHHGTALLSDTYMHKKSREVGYAVSYKEIVAQDPTGEFKKDSSRVKFVFEPL